MPTRPPSHADLTGSAAASGALYDRERRMRSPARAWITEFRRGNRKAWTRASKRHLAEHPLCEQCAREGREPPEATDVDHVRPLMELYALDPSERDRLALDDANLQSLCRPCHTRKTNSESHARQTKTVAEQRISNPYGARAKEKREAAGRAPAPPPRPVAPESAVLDPESAILLIPGYDPRRNPDGATFDSSAARKAVRWIHDHCIHLKGALARQPLLLSPVEQAIVGNLFGWKRPDGTRRYREVFLYVPRKFGKTLLAAAIALYVFLEDGEEGAEVYLAAGAARQASIPFSVAKRMALRDPYMAGRVDPYRQTLARLGPDREHDGSHLEYVSAQVDTAHGYDVHCFLLDEVHAQDNGDLWEVLSTGTASRRQPLAIGITTADYDRESLCNEKRDYAAKVRDGLVEDAAFLPILFEASRDDDWRDEATWARANPHYPITPTPEYLRRKARAAAGSPRELSSFLRLHLNVRTQSADLWIPTEKWDACRDPALSLDGLAGRTCYGGGDLGATDDLCAFALWFPEERAAFAWAWCPFARAEYRHERGILPSYFAWAEQGHMKITGGDTADYAQIRREIVDICKPFSAKDIAFDMRGAAETVQELQANGLAVVPFGQGFLSMSGPAKSFEAHVKRGELRHDGNPMLRWCVGNARVETDAAGNIKPTKSIGIGKARRLADNKIDPVVALVMAIGRAVAQPALRASAYETRGVFIA